VKKKTTCKSQQLLPLSTRDDHDHRMLISSSSKNRSDTRYHEQLVTHWSVITQLENLFNRTGRHWCPPARFQNLSIFGIMWPWPAETNSGPFHILAPWTACANLQQIIYGSFVFTARCVCIARTMLCPSHAGILSKRLYISSRFFSQSGMPTSLVFPYQTWWQYSEWDLP